MNHLYDYVLLAYCILIELSLIKIAPKWPSQHINWCFASAILALVGLLAGWLPLTAMALISLSLVFWFGAPYLVTKRHVSHHLIRLCVHIALIVWGYHNG